MSLRGMDVFVMRNHTGKLKGAEVGVWKGEHANGMLRMMNLERLYLVDPYEPYMLLGTVAEKRVMAANDSMYASVKEKFKDDGRVFIVRNRSTDAAKQIEDNSLNFVYIDGNHNYEAVKEDIIAWYPKVMMGGILGGHDYCDTWMGVVEAVTEMFSSSVLHREGPDWWIIKQKEVLSE